MPRCFLHVLLRYAVASRGVEQTLRVDTALIAHWMASECASWGAWEPCAPRSPVSHPVMSACPYTLVHCHSNQSAAGYAVLFVCQWQWVPSAHTHMEVGRKLAAGVAGIELRFSGLAPGTSTSKPSCRVSSHLNSIYPLVKKSLIVL